MLGPIEQSCSWNASPSVWALATRKWFLAASWMSVVSACTLAGSVPGGHYSVSSLDQGFSVGSDSKESACNVGDLGSIPGSDPGSGRFPGGRNGYPVQYSCLENSMDRGAWQAAVHGVVKSWT